MKAKNALSLVLAAGVVAPAIADTPTTFHRAAVGNAQKVGHVYFNLATGEKIVTDMKQDFGPRGTSGEVWVTDNNLPCADIDPDLYTGGFVGVVDDPADVGGDNDDIAFESEWLDWGDVPADTVIDGIDGTWWTEHPDPNEEGVEGFGATWSFYEGDNGFNSCLTRTGLVAFTLFNLFGDPDPGAPGIRGWGFTVDLADFAGDGSTDISFEIGDTDGDPQGAAVHNPFFFITDTSGDGFPDGDLDGDGLADFAHSLSYIQPGTVDFNDDGVPDGDPSNVARTFIDLVAPRGSVDPVTGELTIDTTHPGGSAGSEDAFDILFEPIPDFTASFGTFWFGGFSCDANGDGIFGGNAAGDYRPFSAFGIGLLGPGGTGPGCPVDINGDGFVNFFDIQLFITAFNAGDASIADWNGDGLVNFFDIQLYITDFNAGCP